MWTPELPFSMAFRGHQELLAEVKHFNRHAAFLGGLRSPVHWRACDVYPGDYYIFLIVVWPNPNSSLGKVMWLSFWNWGLPHLKSILINVGQNDFDTSGRHIARLVLWEWTVPESWTNGLFYRLMVKVLMILVFPHNIPCPPECLRGHEDSWLNKTRHNIIWRILKHKHMLSNIVFFGWAWPTWQQYWHIFVVARPATRFFIAPVWQKPGPEFGIPNGNQTWLPR